MLKKITDPEAAEFKRGIDRWEKRVCYGHLRLLGDLEEGLCYEEQRQLKVYF